MGIENTEVSGSGSGSMIGCERCFCKYSIV